MNLCTTHHNCHSVEVLFQPTNLGQETWQANVSLTDIQDEIHIGGVFDAQSE
jgi:hypothetical protein